MTYTLRVPFFVMPLRVAILCEYPTLNGGERSMLACVDRFDPAEVHVTFLAPPHGPLTDEVQRRSVHHIPFDLHAAAGRMGRDDAIRWLVENCRDFDVLHANSLAMGRLTGAAAARLTCRSTAHLRDIIKLSPAAVADLNGNARLIAVSHAVRDFHVAQGVDPERATVIHNGIDVAAFQNTTAASIRRELGIPESAFTVAAIGQICLRKGQDIFTEAAVMAAASLPHAHFLLIGSRHSTKPESVAFESLISARFERAGIGDRFHPLGERSDVPAILTEIAVLVHAARQEPFGRVLLEAAAAGVSIIATDVGGTREMLTDGLHAILVRPDDPLSLANAIVRLATDRSLSRRLGSAARAHVAAQFPIDRSARILADVWLA